MRVEAELRLDFDDVLIRPKRSVAPSRASIDLKREYRFRIRARGKLDGHPDHRRQSRHHRDDADGGGLARTEHAHLPAQVLSPGGVDRLLHRTARPAAPPSTRSAFGTRTSTSSRLFVEQAPDMAGLICIDAANGYTKFFVDRVKQVRELCPKATIMAGNVATPEMVQELLIEGRADIVKVGIGPGSVCTTRKMTGVGYPQLSAIIECADAAHGNKGHICADGGCRTPGDIAKAFGAGADFVMLGGMLAGTDECEGEWVTDRRREEGR